MTEIQKNNRMIALLRKRAANCKTESERKQILKELDELSLKISKGRKKTKMMCRISLDQQKFFMSQQKTPFE